MHKPKALTVGIISDTHGHLPASAGKIFRGVDHIIHAGDIGGPDILHRLGKLAPVTAVRGNTDGGSWAEALKPTEVIGVGSALFYVIHDKFEIDLDPAAAGFEAVISGHTHQPASDVQGKVLFLNPGSATLPRHHHPPTVAIIRIEGKRLLSEFIRV